MSHSLSLSSCYPASDGGIDDVIISKSHGFCSRSRLSDILYLSSLAVGPGI